MSQHIGPRVISATGGSIKRVGNYRIHTFPSELVTDGLVLNLDAGDPRSLDPANTGLTTWTDLSGNGTIGTLTNGPTYDTANGGGISFTSSSQVVVLNKHDIIGGNQNFTIESWIYRTTSSVDYIFGNYNIGFNALEFYAQQSNVGIYWQGVSIFTTSGPISTNTWYYVAAKRDGDNVLVYVNGELYVSGTITSLIPTNSSYPFTIGNAYNYATESFAGTIPIVRVYNRALSNAEIAQNYDALKVRYTSYTNTFTPLCGGASGKVEVLCVAGGGGGGSGHGGGGGGAGGLIYNSAFSVNSNSGIGVTIGSGGSPQNNGGNTTFSSLTSIGGGTGGTEGPTAGNSGGSGGGGSGYSTATTGGSGTSGQGFGGGRGGFPNVDNTYGHGAGGGGAGGAGTDGTEGNNVGTAGIGGSGLSYSISGTSTFYAGGGGGGYWGSAFAGGAGGSGVGGKGGDGVGLPGGFKGRNAIPNTGSGGGGSAGSGFPREGGNGSNGIVIVRYPAADYNVELLIVGGGGGGGRPYGGGGGAGGLIYYSSYPVSAGTKYSVTVGAGGLGYKDIATPGDGRGQNGNNSSFTSLVAFGGGGGGAWVIDSPTTGNNGGSGGGGGAKNSTTAGAIGGNGISGQGNSGGNGRLFANGGGGGGGGASEIGETSLDVYIGADGGDGIAYSISGTSTYYAGGGAGGIGSNVGTYTPGTGGLGGGGNGGYAVNGVIQQSGQNGTTNTGGGGGGAGGTGLGDTAGTTGNGGDGGSGIVIIAYKGPQRGIGGTVDTTSRPGYTLHRFTTTGTDFFIP